MNPQHCLFIIHLCLFLLFDQCLLMQSSRILVRTVRRSWCLGSKRLEHLRGRCMLHYECVQRHGVSIGHCFTNLIVGSCCKVIDKNENIHLFNFNVNHNEIQSKYIGAGDGAQGKLKMSDLQTITKSHTTTATSINISHENNDDQNPIKSRTTTTNTNDSETTIPIANSIFNWSSSSTLLDESIINTSLVHSSSSSPKPVEVNQNEFYEIINNNNRQTTSDSHNVPNTNMFVEDISSNNFPGPSTQSSTISMLMIKTNKYQSTLCGVRPLRPTGRVVGGRNAQFGEWPWQVLIKEKSWLGFFTKSKCGGVLIDYKWILTAAHCQPGMMGSLIVMLGQHELYGVSRQLRPVVKTVKRMIVHRDFDPDTFDNDIALLELETPFEMQPHIVPICLPTQEDDYVGQFAYVAGWGKLSYGGIIPSILQTVRLPIIDNHVCQTMFADAGHYKYIRDSFLCAGYPQGGRDTCEGDSGGPLMMLRDNVWTLIGTVSHGIKCAEPNLPGVYMKTWSYLPWIRGIIDKNH